MSNEVKTKEKVDMDPKYIIKLTVTLLLDLHGRGRRCWAGSTASPRIRSPRSPGKRP